jgi:four helix bundle protein
MEKKKPVRSFEDLMVWQMGIELVKRIYVMTSAGAFNKDFGLRDQIRRAGISIPTNIAEGFERASRKEYLLFLNIAKGSAGEVRSLLRIALEVGYLEEASYLEIKNSVTTLSSYLFNQIRAIRNSQVPAR